eukprot:1110419-Prorocentrum_minimum.AAC.1
MSGTQPVVIGLTLTRPVVTGLTLNGPVVTGLTRRIGPLYWLVTARWQRQVVGPHRTGRWRARRRGPGPRPGSPACAARSTCGRWRRAQPVGPPSTPCRCTRASALQGSGGGQEGVRRGSARGSVGGQPEGALWHIKEVVLAR